MSILPSGSILPAGLFEQGTDSNSAYDHSFKNYGIKIGIIINKYEPDDLKNFTKAVVEYDVVVSEQNEMGSQNIITYQNCIASELFGGIGDFFEFKYRPQNKADKAGSEKSFSLQNGAHVIVACANGSSEKAIIIGAVKHPKRKTLLTQDSGHSMAGEFNGISVGIDKEGAFKLSFKGKTDNEGKPLDEKVGGSSLIIEKDGSVVITDGNKETVRIDKTKKTISVTSESDISVSSEANLKTSSSKDTIQAMAKWGVTATGSVSFSGESYDISSKGAFNLKTASYSLLSEGEAKIKGSTVDIKGNEVTIGDIVKLGGPAATPAVIGTTMFLGTGNLGAPVVSSAIGPFSAVVSIA